MAEPAPGPATQPSSVRSYARRAFADDARRWLGWGGRIALVAMMTWIGSALATPWGLLVDLLIGLALGLALLGLGTLLWQLLRWVANGWPRVLGSAVLVATLGALALLIVFEGLPPLLGLSIWAIWLLAATCLVVAALQGWRLLRRRSEYGDRIDRAVGAALAGSALLLAVALIVWWWWPGAAEPVLPLAAGGAEPLVLPDPGVPGPLPVATLRYGSGAPGWRPEYGQRAALRTEPVDLSEFFTLGPVARTARGWVLGYGLDAVPRNAVVYYPSEGEGPFPLVLVAHGNANLFVPSEDGYAWLGRHLASHGFVVASIDAAVFNALPIVGGLRGGENHTRALLMLAHLQSWQAWDAEREPLLPRVDLDRIALLGHSRGGEAAAIAASIDRMGRLPADALETLEQRFGGPHGVRAVVALAPSDGQYRLGDRPTVLEDVDYLVLHGGFDADVSSFVGERQYQRTEPAPGGFKAAVYIHHANHGQFNDVWGRYDVAPPLAPLLRTRAIMPPEEQQRAGAALITAFLQASLQEETEYRELLRDPRRGADWLPPTSFVTRFDAGPDVVLIGEADDVDPTRGSLPGSRVTAEGLALWRVGDPGYRSGVPRNASAVTLGWSRDEGEPPPAYRLLLPVPLAELVDEPLETLVTLEVGRGRGPFADGSPAPTAGPLDLSLAIVDQAGTTSSLPLSSAQGIPPHLPTVVTRLGPFEAMRFRPDAYPLFQRIDLPLAALLESAPELDVGQVLELALVFDRTTEGIVVLRSLRLTAP
jgi:dienelactone hydrolase